MKRHITTLILVALLVGVTAVTASGAAVAAPGNNSSTSTSTPTQNITADLYVEQPRYVDSAPSSTTVGGVPTYVVSGRVHEVALTQINHSSIVRSGVREDGATLKYDKRIGRYILDSQGTAGTYRLFWIVREGGETQTVRANVKIKQASYEHLSPSKFKELKKDADLAQWVISEFEAAGILSEDATLKQVKSVVGDAITWYKFYLSPLAALGGQFMTLAIMLAKWPAGWIIFASLFIFWFWRSRKTKKENRRLKRQFADVEDIDEAERRAWERELKRILSMKTFQDLGLTDTDAQAVREHFDADNPRQFLGRLRDYLSEDHLVGLLLSAHDQRGYVLAVERDGDQLLGVDLVAPDDPVADGGPVADIETVAPAEASEDTIYALDWSDLDPQLLWADDVDPAEIDLPVNNDPEDEGDDLISHFGVPVGEDGDQYHIIERREEFVELLVEIIEHIAASDYTDSEGRIKPEADMLDFLYTFTSVSAEKYRWPLWHTRDILLRTRQMLDPAGRMEDLAERSKQGDL